MVRELGRRIAMIVLIGAVATGVAVPVSFAGPHHDRSAVSLAMGMGDPAGCAHEGCPAEQNSVAQGTCFSACAGVTVLPPVAVSVYAAIAYDVMTPTRDLALVDRGNPPDPYPPKHA